MKAILKSEAKQMFNRGENVYFMPSKFDANCSIYAPSAISKKDIDCTFESYIFDYEQNHCNKNVGQKVKFWNYNN